MIKRNHIIVTGRVQGVGFRAFVQHAATLIGVTGYVRNMSDGSVEIVAEGTQPQLDEVLSAVREGSPFSEIEEIKVRIEEPRGDFSAFEVKR